MKTGMKLTLTLLTLSGLVLLGGFSKEVSKPAAALLGEIPVQNGGRIKPFETFAEESLLSVTGKRQLQGMEATAVVWQWVSDPEAWFTKSFLTLRHKALKEELGLMVIGGKVSPEIVLSHQPFQAEVEKAMQAVANQGKAQT